MSKGFLLAHNTIIKRTQVIVESVGEDGRGDLALRCCLNEDLQDKKLRFGDHSYKRSLILKITEFGYCAQMGKMLC